ncbi:hypothetical protein [Vreelandella titanicae]|uniref:hypothetical protein n=1 Tax=Vreelandella titanicae TaxID=664683 RepID=UPI00382516BC
MKNLELGHLNIPKPELERFSFTHDIQTRLYLQYSEIIERTDIGKQAFSKIESDPRVIGLEGHMISKGSSASIFEPTVLAMWFLWAINEFGQKVAEENLNTFLDTNETPVINTLWVLGIEVDETIHLANGLCITPISEMPSSREKEFYLRYSLDATGHQLPKPRAAITYVTSVSRSDKDNDPSSAFEKDKVFWDSSKLLYDLSLALNAIEDTSCIPYFSTAYTLPEMPVGVFGGSGGGAPLYDIIGRKVTKVTADKTDEINSVLLSLLDMPEKEKAQYSRVLSRLSQAKRREQIEDKILDLGIALEMALLEDNKNNQQLSLSFRLRGSWLISSDDTERLSIYRQLRDIYNYRSQVAHGGVLCGNDERKIRAVRESFPGLTLISERIVRRLICEEKPDWSKLLLGIT